MDFNWGPWWIKGELRLRKDYNFRESTSGVIIELGYNSQRKVTC
jgi:hypothetical protein